MFILLNGLQDIGGLFVNTFLYWAKRHMDMISGSGLKQCPALECPIQIACEAQTPDRLSLPRLVIEFLVAKAALPTIIV